MSNVIFLFVFTVGTLLGSISDTNASDECLSTSIKADYAHLYGSSEKEIARWMVERRALVEGAEAALIVADAASCGSQGCEYAVYIPIRKDCVRRVMDFVGSYRIDEPELEAMRSITVINSVQGEGRVIECRFRYVSERRQYLPTGDCQNRAPSSVPKAKEKTPPQRSGKKSKKSTS